MARISLFLSSKMILVLTSLLLCSANPLAHADDGSSGCGMGWKIAPHNSLISSTTRSYVNVTFSNTSGMTSGTSGCARHTIVQNEKKAIHFAEVNQGQLMIEMAQGQGEHLRGLVAILGCADSSAAQFGVATQSGYSRIFPTSATTPSQMLDGVRSVIQSEPKLAKQCGLTG